LNIKNTMLCHQFNVYEGTFSNANFLGFHMPKHDYWVDDTPAD